MQDKDSSNEQQTQENNNQNTEKSTVNLDTLAQTVGRLESAVTTMLKASGESQNKQPAQEKQSVVDKIFAEKKAEEEQRNEQSEAERQVLEKEKLSQFAEKHGGNLPAIRDQIAKDYDIYSIPKVNEKMKMNYAEALTRDSSLMDFVTDYGKKSIKSFNEGKEDAKMKMLGDVWNTLEYALKSKELYEKKESISNYSTKEAVNGDFDLYNFSIEALKGNNNIN